jgi:ParB family transcriptional regulator, chromosome partitioning protein
VANIIKKKGLGKGLGALIGGTAAALSDGSATPSITFSETLPDGSRLLFLNPSEIEPNPKQPRRVFSEDALAELAASIKRDGVQEPVIVRKAGARFELVSGERRVRASIMADLEQIPAICRDVSDSDMLKLGLIENIQREDLNPIELAIAYHDLVTQFSWTQEELAAEIGKNRVTVANTLRLLHLPEVVQEQVAGGELTAGHAKALLAIETPDAQIAAARKIIKQGLSVREAEQLAAQTKPKEKKSAAKDPNITEMEDALRRSLGTKVFIKTQKNGRGKIEIEYFSLDEFDRLLRHLRINH